MNDADWRSRVSWVVVHPDRPEVLAVEQAGVLALPETELPAKVWTAEATAVLPAVGELVGFDVVLLCCVGEHEDEAARLLRATLMAAPRAAAPPGPGARWVGREDLAGAAFQHHDQPMVAGVLDELAGEPAGPDRAPWVARGWFQAAEGWLRGTLDTLGNAATGPVQQVQVWELSCILRAPTTAGDVWFKASRDLPLFVNEAVLIHELAGLFPDHVPAPLAIDAERRWMALADFGPEVGWDAPVAVREDVLGTFARLQIQAASQVDQLLGMGCLDRRLPWLAAQAERWLPAVDQTGRLPGIDAATWLSADEEAELAAAGPGWRPCAASSRPAPSRPRWCMATCTCRTWPRAPTATCSSTGPTPASPTRSSTCSRSSTRRTTPFASGCATPTSPSGPASRRPTGCGAPGSWPSPWARCTTRSATARSSPTSTRRSTCT
jgi:hypothetical protein